jgi:WD40 repeat protein
MAFSPTDPIAAVGSDTGHIEFWDVESIESLGDSIALGDTYTLSLAFSPEGKTLVSSAYDGKVQFWDVETREQLASLPPLEEQAMCVAYSPDGSLLVTAGGDYDLADLDRRRHVARVRLWDARTRELRVEFKGHLECVMRAEFSHDGTYLVTSARDGKVQVWEVAHLLEYGAKHNREQ